MILSVLFLSSVFGVECPEGWSKEPQSKRCYKAFENEKLSWNSAETKCQQFGGDLASITSRYEQDYIVSLLNRNNYDYYWVGLNDLSTAGKYSWVKTDGTKADYSFKFWSPGMPTDNNGARCTFLLFSDFLPGCKFLIFANY